MLSPSLPPSSSSPSSGHWTKGLTRYHWFVLGVAALGWLFDTMDQQLFTLARGPAMKELLGPDVSKGDLGWYGGLSTMIFMLGWASGGLMFGVLGDRIGRARTMVLTVLSYSLCTGLSAWAFNFWDFSFYRFLTGLGVGGEFAVGVALVAEVMPDRARPFALGLLQALSAVGNIMAGLIGLGLASDLFSGSSSLGWLTFNGAPMSTWRIMFLVGALPALLVIVIQLKLKEPERWKSMSAHEGAKKAGSYSELFTTPRWRRNAIVGLLLAASGVVGLWGIGFFMPELVTAALKPQYLAAGKTEVEAQQLVDYWKSINSIMQNIGAFFGMYAFTLLTSRIGRKPTFAISFLAAMLSTAAVFAFFNNRNDIFWMTPIMGFCQLSLFGGYAIYFPELFPTRLRSTGTSFCYNVGRYVASLGPLSLGYLSSKVFGNMDQPIRYAGITMCAVFIVGLVALPFAPETGGKPLPE